MNAILNAIARWIEQADVGDLTAVIFVTFASASLALVALAVAIHGFSN